jgi:hypothetical protein
MEERCAKLGNGEVKAKGPTQLADLLRRTRWDRGRLTDEAAAAALGGTTTADSSGEQRRGFFLGQTAFRRVTRNSTGGWE